LPAKEAMPKDKNFILFSESNTRFLCEVSEDQSREFEALLGKVPLARIGETADTRRLRIEGPDASSVIDADVNELKEAWQAPLRW
jgi:phosphoribosylformylglycinamidine synthase subunit PurSL